MVIEKSRNDILKDVFTNNGVISYDNVQFIGEAIAISTTKKAMAFMKTDLDNIYRGLVHDTFDGKPLNESLSDGYDLAQDAILFLLENIGKRIYDIYAVERGFEVSIHRACTRKVYNSLERYKNNTNNTTKYCDLVNRNERFVTIEDCKETDYQEVDKMIQQMKLKKLEQDVLNCYLGGMRFCEIGRFLNISFATVWTKRQKLRKKYIANFGDIK